jgi:hypothetical protein
MTLREHLDASLQPKRILALDGGGIRGIVSLQYLARLEELLRDRLGQPELVLSDYFDLIGGTSTGAIIAAALALGFPVEKIQRLYLNLATMIFKKPWFRMGLILPKFGNRALEQALRDAFGADTTMGSDRLRCGLMIMTKRMDTRSPWPLTNNPEDPYFQPQVGKRRIGNANMLLWQIVRASTAAPHFFRPEPLVVGSAIDPATGHPVIDEGEFVDGGVSPCNNPSLQLLQVAMLDGFRLRWAAGAEKLLILSVGTGSPYHTRARARGLGATAGAFAASALMSLMDDCEKQVETMMQWMSKSVTARRMNGQIEDLRNDLLAQHPLFTYLRYNVLLEEEWVRREAGLEMDQEELDALAPMDRPGNMPLLAEIARAAAARQIHPEHIPAVFDPPARQRMTV